MVRLATLEATGEQWPGRELIELPKDHPFAYAALIEHLWKQHITVVNVEQDIVPPSGSLLKLLECRHVWCLHPYQVGGRISGPWLGLVKFAGRLLRQFPDVPSRAFHSAPGGPITCRWQDVGSRLAKELQAQAFEPHYHWPTARHLHKYSSGTI